jgi:hypothetical protein
MMNKKLFQEFMASPDTLRVYADGKAVFSSTKERLIPLIEYLDTVAPHYQNVIIYDKIMGNAAALLSIKAGAKEVYSPLGSEHAVKTLKHYHIVHEILKVIPCIMRADGTDMCPMEKLSIGKTPEEFYQALKAMGKKPPADTAS